MKKLSFLTLLLLFGLAVVAVTGCKSSNSSAHEVDALDILDGKSTFYISIPKKADSELVERIIQNNIAGISDKDCKSVVDRIDKIYCGLIRTKTNTEIQASLAVNIPTVFLSSVFSKKAGWEKTKYKTAYSSNLDVYSSNGMDISVPTGKNLFLGRNITDMLETYDDVRINGVSTPQLPQEMYNYLKGADSEIRFYASKPQSFLTILTGTNLNLQLTSVSGCFKNDANQKNQYILKLDFVFKNEKYAKAGKALLNLAFGLSADESSMEKSELKISGIKINKDSLYKLLVL